MGIETVGEIKELIDRSFRYYPNIKPSEIRVVVLEFADRILNEMPKSLATYAQSKLNQRSIEVQLGVGIAEATGTQLVTTTGEVIDTRTIVATIGNTPPPVVVTMPLTLRQGRILVRHDFRADGFENIWAIGDCALIPMTETASDRQDYAPPTAQFAVRKAKYLARNVVVALQNWSLKNFHYSSKGSLASLGAGRGVAEVYGIKLTGRLAWLLSRVYYISFLSGMQTRISLLWNWLMDGFSPAQWFRLIRKNRKMRDMSYTAQVIEFMKMARAMTGFTRSLAAEAKLRA